MRYKTILVHADLSVHAPARIRLAAAVARAAGAHLVGAAMTGISRAVCAQGYSWRPDTIIAGYLDPLYASAARALDQFDAIARSLRAPSHEKRLVCDLPDEGLARLARLCDLVVLSQDDPAESTSDVVAALPESVLLACARPVLVVPYAGAFEQVGKRILVAWDGSREAACAASDAIDFMRSADCVTVALFNPPRDGAAPAMQGAQALQGVRAIAPEQDLAAWLARQQVKAEVVVHHTDIDVGNAVLSMASDLQSDLIVMGCFGHARFRELLLGGVSRTVLDTMTVPVLMAH